MRRSQATDLPVSAPVPIALLLGISLLAFSAVAVGLTRRPIRTR